MIFLSLDSDDEQYKNIKDNFYACEHDSGYHRYEENNHTLYNCQICINYNNKYRSIEKDMNNYFKIKHKII